MAIKKKSKKSLFELDINIGGVSLVQKALFAKNLSLMLKAGLPISEALAISRDSAKGKLKSVLDKVLDSVRSGRSFSDSLAEHKETFSSLFINAAKSGESSGTLVENLEGLALQLKKEKELISKIKGAMMYPVIVLTATFGLGMVLSFVVLPQITPLFEGLKVELPLTTRALISFSHFVQDYGVFLFFGVVGFVLLLLYLVRQKFSQPVTHWLLLRVPILKNLTRGANLTRFSRTLGTLLKSGVPIDEALEITKETVGNYYYRQALDKVSRGVSRGGKLSVSLGQAKNYFPTLLVKMLKVGEESGKFEESLFYLADYYEEEVDNATKTLSTTIEPILLLTIGLVVGFLALSIITPIYDITGNIQR
jgi:type IV pilus assembly protein PilC